MNLKKKDKMLELLLVCSFAINLLLGTFLSNAYKQLVQKDIECSLKMYEEAPQNVRAAP